MLTSWLLTAAVWSTAYASTRSYTLKLDNKIVSPDGFRRSAIVVNDQFPGPLISAKKNDDLEVHVVNNLTDNTMPIAATIHWHGLFMKRAASQDGVAWVTQCPIASGDNFTYKFNIGEQTGTHWYHSHVTTQYCEGLRGPLVIYDDNDPFAHLYDVDDASTIITMHEWYYHPSPKVFAEVFPPHSLIVNGLGRTWFGENTLSVTRVTAGKRYRLRVLNIGCQATIQFSVDEHPLTIIEIDGARVVPRKIDSVVLFPGQRVSVVVNANRPIGNYWIRALASWENVAIPYEPTLAILRYDGAEVTRPKTLSAIKDILHNEESLVPYDAPKQTPREPDVKINLNFTVDEDNYVVNGKPYFPVSVPTLLQILNGTDPHSLLPKGSIITVPRNKLIEISMPGGALDGPHPFHLHGHSFQVVRGANSSTYNYVNPPIRDTVNTGHAGDNVTIRFMTDNPGPWLLHCHMEFHFEAGLGIILAEEPSEHKVQENLSQAWKDLCPRWSTIKKGKKFSKSIWPGKQKTRFSFKDQADDDE
ncbi:hypothetical protein HGRIS_007453 [Hohenbuehelia grisea]|uniref:Laccase n=1 Tax=Hohenbuehelia grisea TaxID=104357 RepID=A0ABR3J4U6_9AGAR